MNSMREHIKLNLRKTTDELDGEIDGLIEACKEDMILSGVEPMIFQQLANPLMRQATVFYAKAYFGNGDESERFRRAYEALRDKLAMGGEKHC